MDKGPGAAYATLWIFQALATTTLILRLISRSFLTRDIGWEDIILAFGWAVNLAGTIVVTISIITEFDITDTTPENHKITTTINALKLSIIASAIVSNAIWLPKISVALLLSRLLQPRPWIKRMLIVPSVIGFAAGGMGSAIITFLQCIPIAGQWNPEHYHPSCWDRSVMVNYFISWAALSATFDIIYAIYPATIFCQIRQLSVSRKLTISILMGLGLISGGVGIYKTTLMYLLSWHDQDSSTALASTHILTMWTSVEANLIISAACIPLSRPVWRLGIRFVKDAWENVRKGLWLGSRIGDVVDERSRERRVTMGYMELPERMSDDSIIAEDRDQLVVRDDIEMRYSPGIDSDEMRLQRSVFGRTRSISHDA